MSKEVNKEKYHLRICYDPVAESVATSFSKLSNGVTVAQYDSENNIWISHTGPEISEEFAKILDSGSPEADILEFLLVYHNPTEKDYQRIKQKYQKLFSLYNKTNCYMEPVFIIPKFAKKRGRCDTISCSERYVPSRILCWNGKESTGINAGIAYG